VEKDGASVHDSTVDVEAVSVTDGGERVFGAEFVSCTWDPENTGDFVVTAHHRRTDETVRVGVDKELDGGCHWLSIRVDNTLYAHWNECEPYDGAGHLCSE
jgi:hypothetical protein